jgi:hypothetical protein
MAARNRSSINRKSKLSASARKQMNTHRRQIGRQQAAQQAARETRIREELETVGTDPALVRRNEDNSVLSRGVAGVLTTVASSWDVTVPITIRIAAEHAPVDAWTDFKQIHVTVPGLHRSADGSFDQKALRKHTLALLGIGYHEVGHNIFTVPMTDLPWQAAFGRSPSANEHWAWNALEDQRMETAMVTESPIIAKYFSRAVLDFLCNELGHHAANEARIYVHTLLVGRTYLPDSVRKPWRDLFISKFGIDTERKLSKIVNRYITATEISELLSAVVDMAAFMDEIRAADALIKPTMGDDHMRMDHAGGIGEQEVYDYGEGYEERRKQREERNEQKVSERVSKAGETTQQSDDDDSNSGQNSATPGETTEGEYEAPDYSNENKRPESKGNGQGSVTTNHEEDVTVEVTTEDVLNISEALAQSRSALDDLTEELLDSKSVSEAALSIQRTEAPSVGMLPTVRSSGGFDQEMALSASALSVDLENALRVAAAANAPRWHRRTDQGVVDSFIYRTKGRGDRNFYRQRTGNDSLGFDVAVSLLLDTSSSMEGAEKPLSVVAFAVKTACERLDIPCTVTTFDSQAWLVWSAEEEATETLLPTQGATHIAGALSALTEQDFDKQNHIVLVMTDGQFSLGNCSSVKDYAPDATYVGLGYGGFAMDLSTQGFDVTGNISDLAEIAVYVEDAVAATV